MLGRIVAALLRGSVPAHVGRCAGSQGEVGEHFMFLCVRSLCVSCDRFRVYCRAVSSRLQFSPMARSRNVEFSVETECSLASVEAARLDWRQVKYTTVGKSAGFWADGVLTG